MKLIGIATILLLCAVTPSSSLVTGDKAKAPGASGASMAKVIQMLTDMKAQSQKDLNAEQVAYAEFSTYCSTQKASLDKSIATAAEEIELLGAEITKLTAEAKALGEEVASLQAGIASDEKDQEEQTAQRKTDHENSVAEQQDYGESADALTRAIMVLEKQNYDRPAAAAALVQLSDTVELPVQAQSVVAAFVSMLDRDDQQGDFSPEANAYEFQSGGIVQVLKRLKEEFAKKKGDCEKEEMNSLHAYNMIMQDLTDSIENAKRDIEEKSATKAAKEEKCAQDKKDLAATLKQKAEDEKTLSDLTTECEEKKLSFEEKQKLRAEEIEAIAKAIEILSSPEAAGAAEKYFNLVQAKAHASSFLQLGNTNTAAQRVEGVRHHLRKFLESESKRLKSEQLGLLAMKVGEDPFGKVKKLIDNMITRLIEEQNEDAKKEGWCDEETGKSKVTRTKLSEDIDALTAAIDSGKSTISMLTQEITSLTKEVADLESAISEATELRNKEREENQAVIDDAVAAQQAVAAATAVLKDYYSKASMATAFVQTSSKRQPIKMGSEQWEALANPNFESQLMKDAPAFAGGGKVRNEEVAGLYTTVDGVDTGHTEGMQTFGETYKGKQDSFGGVLALLEVIQSDFAGLESDTKAAETESQNLYESFMIQAKKDVETKSKKIEMNTADKAAAEQKLQEDTADLKRTQDELLAAQRAYEIIEDQCVDKGMTWDERVAARQSEIDSLKQALKILGSADAGDGTSA